MHQLCGWILLTCFITTLRASDVVDLTSENFDDKVSEGDWMIELYVS